MRRLYGLIGEKLHYSLSPQIHNLIFRKLDIQADYHLFEVDREDIESAIYGLQALKIRGVNVTIPYKVDAMKHLHHISKRAEKIGAINTILIEDHQRLGFNTDYTGFGRMLEEYKIAIKNKKAVILGTGGAAKAVAQFLMDHGIGEIAMISRDIKTRKCTDQDLNFQSYENLQNLKNQDIIVNCTPLDVNPLFRYQDVIGNYQWAIDLNYRPAETLFLQCAKQAGLKTANGLFMLVAQAIVAQEIWQKKPLSQEFAKKIYKEILRTIKDLYPDQ